MAQTEHYVFSREKIRELQPLQKFEATTMRMPSRGVEITRVSPWQPRAVFCTASVWPKEGRKQAETVVLGHISRVLRKHAVMHELANQASYTVSSVHVQLPLI